MRTVVSFSLFIAVCGLPGLTTAADLGAADGPREPSPSRLQVGEYENVSVRTAHPYRGATLDGIAEIVEKHEMHHPGATYIAPYFAHFDLAPGDWVEVRSPDGARSWRYEDQGKDGRGVTGGFWGIHVPGDTAVVELHSPGGQGGWGYEIDRIARGTVELWTPEAVCGTDDKDWARCYEASDPVIYDRSRIVARLLIQGSGLCTGWLVGNEGHVMTNNHCIGSTVAAGDTDFELMAEGSCGQFCGQLQCPGPIVATSSTLIRTSSVLDYSLVKLPVNPTPTYGFATLRPSGPILNERIYLPQHPLGRGKQIAVVSTDSHNPSGFAEVDGISNYNTGSGLRRVALYFADTEGGSSGSPVIAHDDHRVIALHFGTFNCTTTGNGGTAIDVVIADLGADLPESALALFVDGFDSGTTDAWSTTAP